MKYCSFCGERIHDQTVVCPHCGGQSTPIFHHEPDAYRKPDCNSTGFNILSFLFPIVGIILYCVWKDDYPKRAKGCGKWAVVSICVNLICSILYLIILYTKYL